MKKLKVTTIVGTRPEIIRLSSTIKLLDKYFIHRLIHTGQNPAAFMKDIFFKELGIRRPDTEIQLENLSLGSNLASIFIEVEKELSINRPDAVVVLGDTNSCLSVIIAKRMQIPVYHLEAGNRSFDLNVPEEINRKLVDHSSDFNLVYSEHARRNLLNEGISARNICLIGSPMNEVINQNMQAIQDSMILDRLKLQKDKFFVVSAHRQENIDDEMRLTKLIGMLNEVAVEYKFPIIVTAHPRIKEKLGKSQISINEKILFIEPLGFLDYCKLQLNSLLVISDSGSVSEESVILGFKALTLRDSMERPEALEAGSILMSGINSKSLVNSISFILESEKASGPPGEYAIDDSSRRTINFILSTVHNYRFWTGIRPS
ncbi:WecB UDP-N-acetylglucosamine 2-epimerase [Candidatus Nanopelagicaceae bacterium]